MNSKSLLPADTYKVINKTILTDFDRRIITALYEPIIGPISASLYFTLWHDLETHELISCELNHHHLLTILKCDLNIIKSARESLEAIGLLKSYVKKDSVNNYIYELYSPLMPNEFFTHPVLNIVLYKNVGREEYEKLKLVYQKVRTDLRNYEEVTKTLDEVFESSIASETTDLRSKASSNIKINNIVDFDLLLSSMPKDIINEKAFTKKIKELINYLAFIYDLDTLKMSEIIRGVLNKFGMIDKNELRISTRKVYQFKNNTLPTLVYRSTPEYLKTPSGDMSMKGKIIAYFENTSPYDFLRGKNHGVKPAVSELKIVEKLLIEYEMTAGVVNVLLDYVLKKNNNKLIMGYVETIASQWKRAELKNAKEAMIYAENEHKKMSKRVVKTTKNTKINSAPKPIWFDENIEKAESSEEEAKELNELLKEFK